MVAVDGESPVTFFSLLSGFVGHFGLNNKVVPVSE